MKKVIKIYMAEHMELWIGMFIFSVLICGSMGVLEHNTDFFYLGILYLFIFGVGVCVHFYKRLSFYQSLLRDIEKEEDIFVEGNSPVAALGRAYQMKVRKIYEGQLSSLRQENQNYRLVMNKWVHQMKTPVSVLSMMTQEEAFVSSERIAEETKRMDYLLNQVLQLLRMEYMKNDFIVERCRLGELVKSAVNEQKSYFIQNEIYPKMEIDSSMCAYTDKKWFLFAIGQILSNAVKYSETGQSVLIHAERKGREIYLYIQDFGIGILPEDVPRIFDFCFTGNNGRVKQKESSGLGLYLAKQILDYLEHPVEVSSIPGEGTVFTIILREY